MDSFSRAPYNGSLRIGLGSALQGYRMELHRKLGFGAVFCIASGAMISSGLFVLPGTAFAYSGAAVVAAYALASLLMVPALLAQAELSSAMPKSGGSYFFVERSMGALPGTLAGLSNWFSIALKSAFAMIGIGAFAQLLWPQADLTPLQWEWRIKAVAIAGCAVFTVLNVLSVKMTGRFQTVMVAVLLAAMGVFVLAGVPSVRQHPNFDDFAQKGWPAVFATAGLVFVSFGGLTKVAGVAEEIRQPGTTIPRAMVLSWAVVSLLYVLCVFVVVGVCEPGELARDGKVNLTPLSTAAGKFLGTGGVVLMSVAAILAFVTTGNSGILAASRSPMAMSRDGLLPPALGKISHRFGTPWVSIVLTGAFMVVTIAALSIDGLIKVASTIMLILFLLMNVAVLIMRFSRLQNYRPVYRMPWVPWLPLVGIGVYAALIVLMTASMGRTPLVTTGAFVLAGTLWYVLYVRRRTDRESALVYMVRRIVSRQIYRGRLEEELKQIALERDEVIDDRFDRLIGRCEIVDVDGSISSEELFEIAAGKLALRIGVGKDTLLDLLRRREEQSSTIISPGVAIPHVIVDGHGLFEVLLVRCLAGVDFVGAGEPVRVAFILVGSADERNDHLRALMAVAHIIQEEGFTRRWLRATGPEQLRDIVLLSGRRRDTPRE